MDNIGTVYFFTGLSGAGKTTLGGLFYQRRRATQCNIVLLDGDRIRPVYLEDIGYGDEERRKGAKRTFRVAKMLADQGIDVVVCSMCLYHEIRAWNRENIQKYCEIYVNVSRETLLKRNQKGLYTSGKNVVGIDLPFEEPTSPDVILENNGDKSPEEMVIFLEQTLGISAKNGENEYESLDIERGHGQPHGRPDIRAS
jgi:adenylylsulfate kinase